MECRKEGQAFARPLSPHLSIYRPQFTSVTSIAHRISGVGLYVCLVVAALWVISSGFYGHGGIAGAFFGSWLGKIVLFPASFAMFYHASNGVRHLLWDAGKGFELSCAKKSALAVTAVAAALTVLCWGAWLLCD